MTFLKGVNSSSSHPQKHPNRQVRFPGHAGRVRAHGQQVRRLPRAERAGPAPVREAGLAVRGRPARPPRRRALRAHAPARVLQQSGKLVLCNTTSGKIG